MVRGCWPVDQGGSGIQSVTAMTRHPVAVTAIHLNTQNYEFDEARFTENI